MIDMKRLMDHFKHDIRKVFANKFLIITTILTLYFLFAAYKYGLKDGLMVMVLTWSFFVLATPVPDGGIILDLPIRYLFGLKMFISEVIVWLIAIAFNIFNLAFNQEIYNTTLILKIFKDILINPFPYGLIILLSGVGTFFTLYVGDEVYDVLSHNKSDRHKKHNKTIKFVVMLGIIVFVIVLYDLLLKHLGVNFI